MDAEVLHNAQEVDAGRRAVRAGLFAALLWLGVEFGIRNLGGVAAILTVLAVTGDPKPLPGHIGAVNSVLLIPDSLVLWVLFDRRIRQDHISLPELGYRFTWAAGVIGIACGIGLLGILAGTASIDARIFGSDDEHLTIVAATPMLGTLARLVGNGLLSPVVEELAWRGYIQGRLALGWGPRAGLVATALLFAAKHVIVDISVGRTLTLVVGSLALGVIRARWGTFESTLAHVAMNFTATTVVVFMALTR